MSVLCWLLSVSVRLVSCVGCSLLSVSVSRLSLCCPHRCLCLSASRVWLLVCPIRLRLSLLVSVCLGVRHWTSFYVAGCRTSLHVAWCRWMSLDVAGCRWVSLYVAACRCMSLHIAGCRCMSLHVAGCRCRSLDVAACRCMPMHVAVCLCMPLYVAISRCVSYSLYCRCHSQSQSQRALVWKSVHRPRAGSNHTTALPRCASTFSTELRFGRWNVGAWGSLPTIVLPHIGAYLDPAGPLKF